MQKPIGTFKNPSELFLKKLSEPLDIYQTFREITEMTGTCQNMQEPIGACRNPSEW